MIDVDKLVREYLPDNDLWSEEDELIGRYKRNIMRLEMADRIIFLLYVELASYRKVAKMLGCSHTLISKEINRIKKLVKDGVY